MSNVAGKAYGMNVVTPMRPMKTWVNGLLFMASRALPSTLSGLLGLSLIHFARWVFIKRDQWPQRGQPPQTLRNDYMLFCSNFNGTWDQYIDAFADGIPGGLDLFWYSSTKYPNSIPITPFKNYIRANQIDTNYYYNATPGSGQRDIKQALRLAALLRDVDTRGDDAALAAAYDRVMLEGQLCLGAPGYAPVASCDTAAADLHRCAAVHARWGDHAAGPPPVAHVLHAIAPTLVQSLTLDAPAEEKAAVQAAIADVVDAPARLDEAPPLVPPPAPPPPPPVDPDAPPPTDAAKPGEQ
jgi:hypothetical protein